MPGYPSSASYGNITDYVNSLYRRPTQSFGSFSGPFMTRSGMGSYGGTPPSGGITPADVLEHLAMIQHARSQEAESKSIHSMDQVEENRLNRSANPSNSVQAALSPFQSLMAMAQGGGGGADLSAYLDALKQSRAQTSQNQADIGSWYGQLSGMYNKAGKANRKTSKKMRGEAKAFNAGLVAGQADKGVGYGLAQAGQAEGNYLMELGQDQSAFDRRLSADAVAQGNYQKMVQARLGAQERAGIRDDMRSAAAASQGESWDRMMQVLGLMDNPEVAKYMMTGDPNSFMESGDPPDFGALQSALGDSADSMFRDYKDPATGDTVQQYTGGGGFENALQQLRGSVGGAGLDINDPAVREAFRRWVQGNFQSRYNTYAPGPDYYLSGQSFRQS